MDDIDTAKAGDEVRVFDVNGNRVGQPEGGWVGKVVKVGSKLVHIDRGWDTETYRLDSHRRNDAYGHQWYETLARGAINSRIHTAEETLREAGISLRLGKSFTVDQLEALAALVESFKEEG